MTNNQLCALLGITGCVVSAFCMGLMFFGMMSAIWGALVGCGLCALCLVNYD